jgi:hypothetical protein
MNLRLKYGIIVLSLLISILLIYGLFFYKPGKKPLPPPDITITASALADSFDKAEGHADSLYLYKALSVSGVLARLHKNGSGPLVVTLTGGASGKTDIDCTLDSLFERGYSRLNIGDSVTIRGRCAGRSLNVILVKCIIEK